MLAIFQTHPIQYHAPVWREAARMGIPLHVCYGGDFSVRGYQDRDFGIKVSWDQSLLSGYDYTILSKDLKVKPENADSVTSQGIGKWLDQNRPSAVLAHGYMRSFDRSVLLSSFKRRIPLLYRGEANDSARRRNMPKKLVRNIALRAIYSKVSYFLAIGEEARRHYLTHGVPPEKLIFSPYAVDTASFVLDSDRGVVMRKETRRQFNIPEDAKVVLYSGKLSHRKGVDLLVDAVNQLGRKDLVVLFLGDGELRRELESKQGPTPLVFAGFRNQGELSRFYHAADLLCLPSRHSETWGLVVNEAFHHGLPAVVSNAVGSRWDLVEPGVTGEIAEKGNVEELANALRKCLEYSGFSITKSAVRERALLYTIDRAANGLREAWEIVNSKN